MAVWFASAAAAAALERRTPLTAFEAALLTSAIQAGFVVGTLASALLGLPDRFDPRRIFMVAALAASGASAALAALPPVGPRVLALRFLTGVCLAGVYPIGIRLAATWASGDLGLLVGLLVGALTLGSASPHALAAYAQFDWRVIHLVAAGLSAFAGVAILGAGVGPIAPRTIRLEVGRVAQAWRARSLRLANLGYLGHMWELYAMWTWLAVFLAESFRGAGVTDPRDLANFRGFSADSGQHSARGAGVPHVGMACGLHDACRRPLVGVPGHGPIACEPRSHASGWRPEVARRLLRSPTPVAHAQDSLARARAACGASRNGRRRERREERLIPRLRILAGRAPGVRNPRAFDVLPRGVRCKRFSDTPTLDRRGSTRGSPMARSSTCFIASADGRTPHRIGRCRTALNPILRTNLVEAPGIEPGSE